MNLKQLHDRFCRLKLTEELSKSTIQAYQCHFRSFLSISGATTIDEVSLEVIEDWIFTGTTERKWRPKTTRNALICMSAFLDWCVDHEYISQNFAKKIKKPKLKKPETPKSLTLEQTQLLIQCARRYRYAYDHERHRAVAIVTMFLYAGLRLQELLGLKLEDVDFSRSVIFVEHGKGDKSRLIPLDPRLKAYLQPYLAERESINPYSEYFFVPLRGLGKLNQITIRRLMQKWSKKLGFHLHPHMLRHTFATLVLKGCMRNLGRDKGIYGLSKILGHENIKTTEIYAKHDVEDLVPIIENHLLG